jgi:hypothetical protein
MTDLQEALAQISLIRTHLARGTQFRGYGPRSIAASGLAALAVTLGQLWWFRGRSIDPHAFLLAWILTAVVSAALSCWEAVVRSQKIHCGLSREMIQTAMEQFIPSAVAGLLLTVVVVRDSPYEEWMLPGLWAIAFSLGIFASCRFLPRPVFLVGLWYLVAGLCCLASQASSHQLAPWTLGASFGVGQLLMAAALQFGYEDSDCESD